MIVHIILLLLKLVEVLAFQYVLIALFSHIYILSISDRKASLNTDRPHTANSRPAHFSSFNPRLH